MSFVGFAPASTATMKARSMAKAQLLPRLSAKALALGFA
jgi:hypothetical protein